MARRQWRPTPAWIIGIVQLIVLSFIGASAEASTDKAAEYVRQGIRRFRAGEMEAAERAFAEADVAAPDNPRIAFDRACVLSETGDTDRATELLRESATSRDPELVAESRYNLGSIRAAKAKSIFGNHPEEAVPDVREEGLRLLVAAIGHWRDCLEIDADHVSARHNLEAVRLWIKHMQEVWAQRDRQKRRDEADLLSLLQMIEAEQTQLRQTTKHLAGRSDSPRRRQAAKQAGRSQLELADEMEPLKEKFEQLFEPPAGGAPASAPAPSDEQKQQALGVLNDLANRARSAMRKAAGDLNDSDLASATGPQLDALSSLNEIYMAVAPFQNVLQRSITTQEPLVAASDEIAQWSEESTDVDNEQAAVDYQELARRQTQVQQWSKVLPLKAEQERRQQQAAPEPVQPSTAGPQPNGQPAVQAIEALGQALDKAIELAPQVQTLTAEAVELLEQSDAKTAQPKQEEALELLKEIAESLPKQDQQQDNQEDQQQGEQNQDDKQDSSGDDSQQQPQRQPQQDPTRRQAEAVLRKAREREQERRDRQKQMQRYLRGGVNVEKDW